MTAVMMVEHAVELARLGIEVILVHNPIITSTGVMCDCHKGYACPSIGKHPIDKDWAAGSTTDPAILRQRFEIYPTASIGIPTGRRFGTGRKALPRSMPSNERLARSPRR